MRSSIIQERSRSISSKSSVDDPLPKHLLFLFDANLRGWDVTIRNPSRWRAASPEDDTETIGPSDYRGRKDETVAHGSGLSPFVTALVAGLKGAADLNKNRWVGQPVVNWRLRCDRTWSATRKARNIRSSSNLRGWRCHPCPGAERIVSVGKEPSTEADRMKEARVQYEQAFALFSSRNRRKKPWNG